MQTDACPTGMGGFLAVNGQLVAYWHDRLTDNDAKLFGAVIGDPSYQSEWELLAVWVSLEVFCKFLHPNFAGCQVLLRTDNTSVIQAVKYCKARSPIMSQLAAEISLQCAILQLMPIEAQHVPGLVNDIADRLSRLERQEDVPFQLRDCTCLPVPQRSKTLFRAWPD